MRNEIACVLLLCAPLTGCLVGKDDCGGQDPAIPPDRVTTGHYLNEGDAYRAQGTREMVIDRATGVMTISYLRGGKKVVETWRITVK